MRATRGEGGLFTGSKADPEKLERARLMLEDGASRREVTRTTGLHSSTLANHFPDSGWTNRQAGAFMMMEYKMSKRIEEVWS